MHEHSPPESVHAFGVQRLRRPEVTFWSAWLAFTPALRLYESAGFVRCGPFEGYLDDPFSVFMTRTL